MGVLADIWCLILKPISSDTDNMSIISYIPSLNQLNSNQRGKSIQIITRCRDSNQKTHIAACDEWMQQWNGSHSALCSITSALTALTVKKPTHHISNRMNSLFTHHTLVLSTLLIPVCSSFLWYSEKRQTYTGSLRSSLTVTAMMAVWWQVMISNKQ